MPTWNPWHGCHKLSEGCLNCYVYRIDSRHGKTSSVVLKTADFDLPVRRNRGGAYKLSAEDGTVFTCFSSDFFLEDADPWRPEAWRMIRERSDLDFFIVTKRIRRFRVGLPDDWGDGYENVAICCTAENQKRADERLPVFLSEPIRCRSVICEPLLGPVDLSPYLSGGATGEVTVGGESGDGARLCRYEWVLALRDQCRRAGVPFTFKQTGANFEKDGRVYRIPRRLQHLQAQKAGISFP